MRESAIQAKILKYLKDKAYVIKTIATNKSGVSDIICCYKGKFIAFECKTFNARNNITDLQKHHIEQVIKNGGSAYVVWSLEQVQEIIK